MSPNAIEVDRVWKKFRKGEIHDSLRDLIPALVKRMVKGRPDHSTLRDREFWALRDINFTVKHGSSLGIIGPNGAGKSTLFKLMSRILKPNQGTYHIDGRLSALIEVGAGFHQDLSGRENIYLQGAILGMSRREIKAKEDRIIDFAGVPDFIDTPVKRYSSGMLARLGFAVAAHMEPQVLLIDEVLSVGDARFRDKCIRHMKELVSGSGVTVVFISHVLDQVRMLCPQTMVLDHGQSVYHGPTEGAIRKYLEVLDNAAVKSDDVQPDAEVRNIRLLDAEDREVLQWTAGQPGICEFDLVVHRPAERLSLQVNLTTIGGVYLGTSNSMADPSVSLPSTPGVRPMRFVLDPMVLADGDYGLDFRVFGDARQHLCLWTSGAPRTVSVRGGRTIGSIIDCQGAWKYEIPAATGASVAQRVG